MVRPRSEVLPAGTQGTFHVISRCTRRSFLMGGACSHRRDWVLGELDGLLSGFCIELLAYAVLSNHVHLILRPRPDRIAQWEASREASRVARVGMGFMPVRTGAANASLPLTKEVIDQYSRQPKWVTEYRERLVSVSWLLRLLKQRVSIKANQEDQCTGHFWESRFHCIPLLDWSAVLACMVYVDLNPFRAGLATSLESTSYSSLRTHCGLRPDDSDLEVSERLVPLSRCRPFDSMSGKRARSGIVAADYAALVRRAAGLADASDRDRLSRLGSRLGYDWSKWEIRMAQPGMFQGAYVGSPESVEGHAAFLGRKWIADKVKTWE